MPIVHINLMQGRPPERIQAMITAVSHAIADSIDAPLETVRVLVNEMEDHQYGVGGKPIAQVKAERAAAARQHAADG
ncbi:2-hydroxymuconate tautomerase [Euzebya tangerina]|uniref:2-hydroxymuconate tautomerase n=1 Tax=Euzebya tangerina TaxID=591198 RepID=UPI000E31DF94|nr:2-hydroxymuconate tautomerase [Euzebya tangerina]